MATNSLQSLQSLHHNHSLFKPSPPPPPSSSSSPLFFITTTTTASLSSTTAFSISPTTATTPSSSSSSQPITFDLLQQHLSAQNFREADEETRRLLILLAGEGAVKRGYVFFSEVQFISDSDLKAIDELWKQHSDGKFGYSVQRKIWKKSDQDFSKFFIKIGWMKLLDTEVEQYNYKAFPNEFVWELKEDTPVGHLPLTNALRGTQLLKCVLSHPAFESGEEDDEEKLGGGDNGSMLLNGSSKLLDKRLLKTDYSF